MLSTATVTAAPSAQLHLDRGRELERMGIPEFARLELLRATEAATDYATARTALVRTARCELRCHRPFDGYRAWMQLISLAEAEHDLPTAGHAHERAALVALVHLGAPDGALHHLHAASEHYAAVGDTDGWVRCHDRSRAAQLRASESGADAHRRWARGIAERAVRVARVPPHGAMLVRGCRSDAIVAGLVDASSTAHLLLVDADEHAVERAADVVTALDAWTRVRVAVAEVDEQIEGSFDAVIDLRAGRTGPDGIIDAAPPVVIGGRLVELYLAEHHDLPVVDDIDHTDADRWAEPCPRRVSPAGSWLHWRVTRFP